MSDYGLCLSGGPLPVDGTNVYLTQPTVRQILRVGEQGFLTVVQLFCRTNRFLTDVREANPAFENVDDFILLMMTLTQKDADSIRADVGLFFDLVFPDFEVTPSPESLDFARDGTVVGAVTPETFKGFQRAIDKLFLPHGGDNAEDYNPTNAYAAKIAKQLEESRKKVAEEHGETNKGFTSVYGSFVSILSTGIPMDINSLLDYTPFQLCDTFARYWLKVKYDFYQRISTTPMMDVSKVDKPEEWTKDII